MGCFPITAPINSCGAINANFDFESDALIGNWDDIASYSRDSVNPTLINALTLKLFSAGVTPSQMFKIYFRETSPMATLAETTEEKSYAKPSKVEGELVIYERTPASALIKQQLDNNKIFLILKQASKKGTSAYYVILGLESGLKPMAGENFVGDKGGYVFKFTASNLTYPQEFLWNIDSATTEAIITALQVQ